MTYTCDARGSCEPECPMYGYCHCGCGAEAGRSRWNERKDGYRAGEPRCWRRGHNDAGSPPRLDRETLVRAGLASHGRDIPVLRVQPLARWLVDQYGSYTDTARATGLDRNSLRRWATGRVATARPNTAKDLVEVVLDHRRRMLRPADPWGGMYEVEFQSWRPDFEHHDDNAREQRRRYKRKTKRREKVTA